MNHPFLTHLAINSIAKARHEICQRERVHWYLGLRQAEIEILGLQEFLKVSNASYQELLERIEVWKRELAQFPSRLSIEEEHRQITVSKEICEAETATTRLELEIRDAAFNLKAVEAERDRILAAHPEAKGLSYEELQCRYSHVAHMEELSTFAASRIWAAQRGFPEAVGAMLFALAPEQQQYICEREMQLRQQMAALEVLTHTNHVLNHLTPEEQRRVALAEEIVQLRLEAAHGFSQ